MREECLSCLCTAQWGNGARARIDLTQQESKTVELEPGEPDYQVIFLKDKERNNILQTLYQHPVYKEFEQSMAAKGFQILEAKTQVAFHEKAGHHRAVLFLHKRNAVSGNAVLVDDGTQTIDGVAYAELDSTNDPDLVYLDPGTGGGGGSGSGGYTECVFTCLVEEHGMAYYHYLWAGVSDRIY